ncbi:hypothetical protein EOD41_03100 [Mucilaginibacter limnophilus]|uniref:Uncharacterized protein n=1 Tax=Mucilaginibacter limnophilus TaxID=1932778 RepID=A0A3S3TK75_9SPHI|nr:hypothetical protein [Mucilaginibacter limnophilus]RVU02939.1 hypothetical protein EOD41_03100 [Mucilaginibacter limnophilus]
MNRTNSIKAESTIPNGAYYNDPPKNDTINIRTISSDTFYESRHDLIKILRYYPEFKEIAETPDITYAKRNYSKQASEDGYNFESEVGQDSYYILYAYFLKQKSGHEDNARRENLVKIFRDINHIYMRLGGGGTYFGHIHSRILGYAEYSVDIYNYEKKYNDLKTYNISAQKKLYTALLIQYINDELMHNFDISDKDKATVRQDLLKTVNHLNGLITDEFYLNQAQEFQNNNY